MQRENGNNGANQGITNSMESTGREFESNILPKLRKSPIISSQFLRWMWESLLKNPFLLFIGL
jgi:hypothetical protein